MERGSGSALGQAWAAPFANVRPAALFALFLVFVAGLCQPARAASLEPLDIQTARGVHRFQVEVMRSDADRARGLMFRRDLAPDRGMLFEFDREEPIQMWMKNTYLPLDMIFIGTDKRVVSIARDTEPLSERIVSSGKPATAVLEVNAGTAARLGIAPGDRMIFPAPGR